MDELWAGLVIPGPGPAGLLRKRIRDLGLVKSIGLG